MKLQEAIQHLEDSLNRDQFSCPECKQEHQELLEYLKELKVLREVTKARSERKGYEGYEGLKPKFIVFKRATGEEVQDCFVLCPEKDMYAVAALSAYATACMDKNPQLGMDICQWLLNIAKRLEAEGK